MDIAQKTFGYVNQKRTSGGKAPLAWEPSLYNLCYEHSLNLSTGKAQGHDGFDSRISRINFAWKGVAENIAYNYNKTDPGKEALNQWVKSAGHLNNIMGDYNVSAIACVKGQNGAFYFTQIFVKK